jgi:hypothetical protein
MKRSRGLLAILGVFLLSLPSLQAQMNVHLKDGSTIKVPVSKENFAGFTFDEPSAGGGNRPSGHPSPSGQSGSSGSSPAVVGNVDITWDFETGDLRGWTQTGTSFQNQPTYGDNPTARNRGEPSNHQGNYWIGTFENRHTPSDPAGQVQGDDPEGTLTSAPFVINTPSISFLLGGGNDLDYVSVELLIDGQAARVSVGEAKETMSRVRWDVAEFRGKTAQIRINDRKGPWGHINVDDFRFE